MSNSREERKVPVKSFTGLYYARRSAEHLLRQIAEGNEHLIAAFIFALCSGIEGAINDVYIDYFYKKMGYNYKEFVKPFIYMNLRDKLMVIIPIVSDYKYQINEKCDDYKSLVKLFELRNGLIHVKQFWRPAFVTQEDVGYQIAYDQSGAVDHYDAISRKELSLALLRDYQSSSQNSLMTSII